VAPPGNQAANRENKYQPIVSEETGLLDSLVHFLQKPFSMKNLAQKISEVTAGK
jgi:hypothetical protein